MFSLAASQHCHQLLCVKFDGCFQRYLSCFRCRHRQTELRKTEVLNYFVVGILCLEFFQTALQRIGKFAVGNNCDARLCRLFRYCRFNFSRQFVSDKFATPRRYAYMYGFAVKQIVEFRRLTGNLCNDVLHVFAHQVFHHAVQQNLSVFVGTVDADNLVVAVNYHFYRGIYVQCHKGIGLVPLGCAPCKTHNQKGNAQNHG